MVERENNLIINELLWKRFWTNIQNMTRAFEGTVMSNIFFEKQFGFRANHSTEHAILCIIDRIQKAIENRNYSCGIFLDFSKAFDTIDHTILIKKLEYYGTRGVAKKWFISYLSNPRQIVTVNGVQSEENSITCGVPQGLVLGPLLFLIYVNDFHSCSDLFDFHMFVDDANLFYESNNIASLVTTVNNELRKACTWLCANKLLLNIDESNFHSLFFIHRKEISQIKIYMLHFMEFVWKESFMLLILVSKLTAI